MKQFKKQFRSIHFPCKCIILQSCGDYKPFYLCINMEPQLIESQYKTSFPLCHKLFGRGVYHSCLHMSLKLSNKSCEHFLLSDLEEEEKNLQKYQFVSV